MSGDFTFLASDRVLLLSRRGWEEPPHIICIWNTNHSANITIYGMSSFFIKDFFEEKTLRLCVREILVMNIGQRSKFQSEKVLSCIVVKGQNFSLRNYCHALWSKVKISVWEIIVMHRGQRSKFQSEKLLSCIVVKGQNFSRRNYCHASYVVKSQNFSRRNYCYAS